jgi:hypothetical protein
LIRYTLTSSMPERYGQSNELTKNLPAATMPEDELADAARALSRLPQGRARKDEQRIGDDRLPHGEHAARVECHPHARHGYGRKQDPDVSEQASPVLSLQAAQEDLPGHRRGHTQIRRAA